MCHDSDLGVYVLGEYCTLKSRNNRGDIEIIRIPLAQSAILSFSYSQYCPIGLDQKGTVLPTHDLNDKKNTHKGKAKLEKVTIKGRSCVLSEKVATCWVCDREGTRVGIMRFVPIPANCP